MSILLAVGAIMFILCILVDETFWFLFPPLFLVWVTWKVAAGMSPWVRARPWLVPATIAGSIALLWLAIKIYVALHHHR